MTYDTIVVGAGSAGCVIAARLSEDPKRRVLLLEAGGDDANLLHRMPAGLAKAIASRKFNWHYQTVPQAHMNGRRIYWPRGRVLGGSSSINAMVMVRGHPADYDAWRQAGCAGWGYDDVLPFFRKMETNALGPHACRGCDGPMYIADPESAEPIFAAFIEAGRQAGFPVCEDFNGKS